MSFKYIYQLIAGAGVGDAITNYALDIGKLLEKHGMRSKVLAPAKHINPDYVGKKVWAMEKESFENSDDILIIYHFSIGSKATDFFIQQSCIKAIIYHNITPPYFFKSLYPEKAQILEKGREQLMQLKEIKPFSASVSAFNAKELGEIGFEDVFILPLIIGRDYLDGVQNKSLQNQLQETSNILFVGRVAPNKKHENLIRLFYHYYHTVDSKAQLILAGSYNGCEKYLTYLKSMSFELGLADKIKFTGHISLNDLITYYQNSDLFLCLSEHEGFCVPLIEAMHFGLPIFALDRAAVCETLGDCGVQFKDLNYKTLPSLINQVLNNKSLKQKVIKQQLHRLEKFSYELLESKLLDWMTHIRKKL